jgi:inosine/xanthosine triphosphate pyrophosphatase family protein
MKCNLPKSWLSLPQKEKKVITDLMQQTVNDTIDREEDLIQKCWLQWACIILHDDMGLDVDQLMMFLGNWKKMYRKNRTFKDDKEQQQYLDERLNKIFTDGFPFDFVNSL